MTGMSSQPGLRSELDRRRSNVAEVLALFKSRPNEWIDWTEIAKVGGALAWRTRVADARKVIQSEGGRLENRQIRNSAIQRDEEGTPTRLMIGRVISEYRYLVQKPLGRDASIPSPDHWPVCDAPTQETFRLT